LLNPIQSHITPAWNPLPFKYDVIYGRPLKMAVVGVNDSSYKGTYSPSPLAWSESWQLRGSVLRSSDELAKRALTVAFCDDGAVNIFSSIIVTWPI